MYNLRSCFKFITSFECTSYKNQVVFCFKEKPKYEQTAQKKRKKRKKKPRKNETNHDDTVSGSENTLNLEATDSIVKKFGGIEVTAEAGCVEALGGRIVAETKMREIPEAVEVMKMFILSGAQKNNELTPPREKKTIPLMSYDRCLLHNSWEEKCESWENLWLKEHGRKLIELCEIVSGMMVEQEVDYYMPR